MQIISIITGRDPAGPEGEEAGVCTPPRLAEAVVSARVEALLEQLGAGCLRFSVVRL